MWQALEPLSLRIPSISQGRSSCQLRQQPSSAFAIPQTAVNLEALQRARKLDREDIAKVLDCVPFRHEGLLYFAVLEEGFVSTLEERVKYRKETAPFTSAELEEVICTLQAALRQLQELRLIYSISQESVRVCPEQVYKLGAIWTCSFAEYESDFRNATICFQTFCRDLMVQFPDAHSSVIDAIINNPLLLESSGVEKRLQKGNECEDMETVPVPKLVHPAGPNGPTVERKPRQSLQEARLPGRTSCECRLS